MVGTITASIGCLTLGDTEEGKEILTTGKLLDTIVPPLYIGRLAN